MSDASNMPADPRFDNLTGRRYERLVVQGFAGAKKTPKGASLFYWRCKCDCGSEAIVLSKSLKAGLIRSCGCLRSEPGSRLRHGYAPRGKMRSEYTAWHNMIRRCHDPNDPSYERYGAKGIEVCSKWRADFAAFIADMGPKPTPKHSIDRVDGTKGYEPDNCRWATTQEQNRNRSMNIFMEFEGERLTLKEYCARVGISYNTVQYRRNVLGWPLERAVSPHDGRQQRAPE